LTFSAAFNWRVPVTGLVVQQATEAGTSFVFGYLGGAESPYLESDSGSSFILAFRALPLVLVMSALLAYLDLARLPAEALSERSRLILTYALCGFANFGSLGIMIGGMGAMIPERRNEIVALGMKSIIAGTLATLLTGDEMFGLRPDRKVFPMLAITE
jgi:nucleoside permease NupC